MSDKAKYGGVGLLDLLLVLFIALKLCHVIEWSWFYVLMPLWIPVCIGLVILASAIIKQIGEEMRYGR